MEMTWIIVGAAIMILAVIIFIVGAIKGSSSDFGNNSGFNIAFVGGGLFLIGAIVLGLAIGLPILDEFI